MNERVQVVHGDCIEVMQQMDPDSIDAIVTDPPYGLGLMGKKWDVLPPGREWAEECLRVLKPGGHILAFGGSRTWHRLAVAIEDGGFEVRDSIAWLYGSGFPRNRATLKPAFEPIVMGRKPFKGSLVSNESEHGTGALNIDSCRIATTDKLGGGGYTTPVSEGWDRPFRHDPEYIKKWESENLRRVAKAEELGRFPANVILDSHQSAALNGQSPNASKFFYVAKAPKAERPTVDGVAHPTVKPLSLMRYLIRLVTPDGGTILDPFAGSGTTVEAATLEGFHSIGIEREAEYIPLIQARLERSAAA